MSATAVTAPLIGCHCTPDSGGLAPDDPAGRRSLARAGAGVTAEVTGQAAATSDPPMMRSRTALRAVRPDGFRRRAPVQDVRVNDISFLIYIFRCGVGPAKGAVARAASQESLALVSCWYRRSRGS